MFVTIFANIWDNFPYTQVLNKVLKNTKQI